jgi:hypothetical protein
METLVGRGNWEVRRTTTPLQHSPRPKLPVPSLTHKIWDKMCSEIIDHNSMLYRIRAELAGKLPGALKHWNKSKIWCQLTQVSKRDSLLTLLAKLNVNRKALCPHLYN